MWPDGGTPAALGASAVGAHAAAGGCGGAPDGPRAGAGSTAGSAQGKPTSNPSNSSAANSGGGGGGGGDGLQGTVWVTTVDLWPHTGRKHQLRRHMALLGHPLLGDTRYSFGYWLQRLASGQALPEADHVKLPAAAGVGPEAAAPCGGGEPEPATSLASAAATQAAAPAAAPVPDVAGEGAGSAAAGSDARLPLPAIAAALSARLGLQLCLWALELRLPAHPATGEPLHFCLPEPAVYGEIRCALSSSAQPSVTL